jgi:hypothetical protein
LAPFLTVDHLQSHANVWLPKGDGVMQVTKEFIQALLIRNDTVGMHAVGKALVVLFKNQTHHEKQIEATTNRNETGFTPSDARRGSGMARFYMQAGFLTPKQLEYWQKPARTSAGRIRITKYWRQLLEAAEEKQSRKQTELLNAA